MPWSRSDPRARRSEDLGSKNGTYVGSRKVRGTVPLADREVVRIGPATLTLRILRRTGSTRSTRGKASRVTLAAGTRLGFYEIRSSLGAGGMGEVYRAHDAKLAREVAIKVLPAELSADPERLQRFEKEARTASALNHPNIVTVYDVGAADGTLVHRHGAGRGQDAAARLLDGGPLPLKRLLCHRHAGRPRGWPRPMPPASCTAT